MKIFSVVENSIDVHSPSDAYSKLLSAKHDANES